MFRFADDISIIASSKQEKETIMNEMERVLTVNYGMRINKDKTKVLVCDGYDKEPQIPIKIANVGLHEVKTFCYLGSQITQDGRSACDINKQDSATKSRIRKEQNTNLL